jgi:signal transduction histidine kinase
MSIRKQIITIFLSIISVALIVVSMYHYKVAREARLQEVFNHMESISEAKKNRLAGIIQKRKEQMVMLQLREKLREDLAAYLKTGDQEAYLRLMRALEITRDRVHSFKEIQLVSTTGIIKVSTLVSNRGKDISAKESFKHALAGEVCLHEIYYDHSKQLYINLSGLMTYNAENLGVIIIKTSAEDILSLITDYTGLGETGETTLAQYLPNGKIHFLTATRFFPVLGDSLIIEASNSKVMSHALNGVEILLTNFEDYRGRSVIASTRFLQETGWGMATKIDWDEAIAPINELLWKTILLAFVILFMIAIAGHYFARNLVKPILLLREASNEIASGNLNKRINYSGKDELGQLAKSFDLMADRLSETHNVLEEKVEQLDKKNEALHRFAYVVSHDLKSPLFAIHSLMTHLKESLGNCDEPDVQKMLGMAEAKATHMLDLINGILHYSLAGVTVEEPEQVNSNRIINEIIHHLDVPENITIKVEDLPNIFIERVLVIQIFQNLIGNAVKYMDKPIGQILIGYQEQQNDGYFYIKDNGRGIERRNFEKIFEIFNIANRVPGIESSGLGLSIVKKIIESKRGKVWVESEVGKGSVFYFTLPQDDVLV